MSRSNLFLFILPTLIWGSTWIAIKFQLGVSSPELSIFLRFLISSALSFLICLHLRPRLRFPASYHGLFFAQGFANFGLNYILTYHSERFLTSGVVALTFTTLIYMNMFGLSFFFKKPLAVEVIYGSGVGGLGVLLLFWHEIVRTDFNPSTLLGIALGLLATASASVGNLLVVRQRAMGIPVLSGNTWGMFYGALLTFIFFLLFNHDWTIDPRPSYWISLVYLSVFGTVIAFAAAMTLVGRIGADRTAYITVVSPVIALLISTFLEGYTWDWINVVGLGLCLLGNILILRKPASAAPGKVA